jgi:hypothetical protein
MAILVHPTRATRDWRRAEIRRGDRMYHVLSDLLGPAGSQELYAFVARCGIRPQWVQYPGTYREHFDAPPDAAACLLGQGARLATNHEVGALLRTKRSAQSSQAKPAAPTA